MQYRTDPGQQPQCSKQSLDRLLPDLYNDLETIALRYLKQEQAGSEMESAALVHEAYLRLACQKSVPWNCQDQLLALASKMMRRILIDHARGLQFTKNGGQTVTVSLDEALFVPSEKEPMAKMLEACLARLATHQPCWAKVIRLRYFFGMTTQEIAGTLGLSTATVTRRWRLAKSWLFQEMESKPHPVNK